MITLSIRTDNPTAEIGLFDDTKQIDYEVWQAHRELAETIHIKIKRLLKNNNMELSDIGAIVCYEGPGSFTGLRIGMSVANALASSLRIKIVAGSGNDWIDLGIQKLISNDGRDFIVPNYGAPVFTTKPKK